MSVSASVYEMGRILPAATALSYSVEYAGVVVFGSCSIITNTIQAKDALQQLLFKYASHLQPGKDYRSITDEELARTSVYQIKIEQWSGKKIEVVDDFPGAFYYSGV